MTRQVLLAIVLSTLSAIAAAQGPLQLEAHRGNVVLVDFWASWCVPCRRSFPWMNQMHERYADDGLTIIAVNLDRKSADAESFLEAYPAEFNILFDPGGDIAAKYRIEVMPSSIIFDRDGHILQRHAGFKVRKQVEYEMILRAALGLEEEL